MSTLPAGALKFLFSSRKVGLISALGNGSDLLAHIGDFVRICDYHLTGNFLAEIGEFFQHLICCTKVNRLFLIRILKLHACKKNAAVDLILLIYEMGVTGSANRLAKLLTKLVNTAVDVTQSLIICYPALGNKKSVVTDGLNFKIIVEGCDLLKLILLLTVKNSVIKLARNAGRTDNKAVTVLFNNSLRHTRNLFLSAKSTVIVKIAKGNQLIEVLKSLLVLREHNHMVGIELDRVNLLTHCRDGALKIENTLFFKSRQHLNKDMAENLCVIRGSVVMELTNVVIFNKCIELMILKLRIYVPGKTEGVKIGIVEGHLLSLSGNSDKSDIEVSIMGNKKLVTRKGKELLKSLALLRSTLNVGIGNGGKLCNFLGNRGLGVNKDVEFINNPACFDLYRTDFNNLAGTVRKTGGLNIKDNHFIVKGRIALTENTLCSIVYKVSLGTVENFKIRL